MPITMIPYFLCLAIVGTLAEYPQTNYHLEVLDLDFHIEAVTNASKYYLDEGAPSITKLFFVENPREIIRLEEELKKKILIDLSSQLNDVWEEMNYSVSNGYKILNYLRDEADRLVKELKKHGIENVLDNVDIKERISQRVKQLLENAKKVFCIQSGNLSGIELAGQQLLNLTSNLEYKHVKIHILKTVYSYRLEHLMNVSTDASDYEMMKEVWVMVNAWGKWAVLDLMAFIKSPLNDLHEHVQTYLDKFILTMQEMAEEALDNIEEIAVATGYQNTNEELLKLFMAITQIDDPVYAICNY